MSMKKATMATMVILSLFCVQGQAQRGPKPPVRPPRKPVRPPRKVVVSPKPAPPKRIAHLPGGARHIIIAGVPYWVHAGVFYRIEGDGYLIVSAPIIRLLPPRHKVIVIGGIVYYVVDGIYYKTVPDGYIVVEEPVEKAEVTSTAPGAKLDELTLYVPKKNTDGFVPVTMKKLEGGFLGPQGEFYPQMPPMVWLTEIYGVPPELRQIRSDTIFIHVPDKKGEGFTRVELTRFKGGFKGPQGEFYPLMPSVTQLTEMYGTSGG